MYVGLGRSENTVHKSPQPTCFRQPIKYENIEDDIRFNKDSNQIFAFAIRFVNQRSKEMFGTEKIGPIC